MRGFFYNRCLNFQSVICISFYHPTDTECNCFPRASAIGRIFMTYQEFKENVIDIWEDCQKKQEQIVEVKTITKAEVKLSR